MSKHTPGPWTVNKPAHDNGRAEVYAGCMLVAQAYNWMLDAEGDEQCWADARLIAAAPELLEALKEITPPMPPTDAPCHVGIVPQEKCAHCGRIARARAVIAKATGEPA